MDKKDTVFGRVGLLFEISKKAFEAPWGMITALNFLVDKLMGKGHKRWRQEFKKYLRQEKCWLGIENQDVLSDISTLIRRLTGEKAEEWSLELFKFINKERCWQSIVKSGWLEFVGEVEAAETRDFCARDRFVIDTSEGASVNISSLGENFVRDFLGKIEKARDCNYSLFSRKLLLMLVGSAILDGLGGARNAETTLVEMFFHMKKQGKGGAGALDVSGYNNIFFIRNVDDVLCTVHCRWIEGGWRVNSYHLGARTEWLPGNLVFTNIGPS